MKKHNLLAAERAPFSTGFRLRLLLMTTLRPGTHFIRKFKWQGEKYDQILLPNGKSIQFTLNRISVEEERSLRGIGRAKTSISWFSFFHTLIAGLNPQTNGGKLSLSDRCLHDTRSYGPKSVHMRSLCFQCAQTSFLRCGLTYVVCSSKISDRVPTNAWSPRTFNTALSNCLGG